MTYLEFLQISYCPHFFSRYGVSPTRVDWIPWPKFSLDCLFSIEPLEFLGMSASAKIVLLYGTHSYDTTSSRFLSQVSSTLCEMIFKSGYDWELCSVTLPKLEMLSSSLFSLFFFSLVMALVAGRPVTAVTWRQAARRDLGTRPCQA
jgi:hypothetical protein